MINQCILEKIKNKNRRGNENHYYYRLKIPVSENLKSVYKDKLEDNKYLTFLFTKAQLNLALNRMIKNPEDFVQHKSIFEILFGGE